MFYSFDPQGGVAQRLDSAGTVLGSYAFDAFGLRTGTDTTADPYSFFGGQWGYYADVETGLELLTHRYYDPAAGRFLTRDPLSYGGGINVYSYVGNNPINGIDPSGFNPGSNTWYSSPFYRDPVHYHGPPPPVPPAPLSFNYDRNIALSMEMQSDIPDPFGVRQFIDLVGKKHAWDPKRGNPHWDDAGNFDFGAVGLGFGFDERTVLAGAGYAQEKDDPNNCYKQHPEWGLPPLTVPGHPFGTGPYYGDDPHGQGVIKSGFI